jgi:dienelactone hydrolase
MNVHNTIKISCVSTHLLRGLLATALVLSSACGGSEAERPDAAVVTDREGASAAPTATQADASTPAPAGSSDAATNAPSAGKLDASVPSSGSDAAPPAKVDTEAGTAPAAADTGTPQGGEEAGPAGPGATGSGACCSDGNCYCRGDAPTKSSAEAGPYKAESYTIARSSEHGGGTVYYPTDAEPPFAGAVICPPLTGVQAMYKDWGPFLASWGIVLVTMDTKSTQDSVQSRSVQLAAMVKQFRAEKDREGSALKGKLGDRIGTMGWSMGGGATWIAAAKDPTLKSSISLAGHNATGGGANNSKGTMVPSMQLNGATDTSILGGLGQSDGVYDIIPETTPKLIYVVRDKGHFEWGGPKAAGPAAGEFVLAFQKTFLEGDARWKQFLLTKPANASTYKTNIK